MGRFELENDATDEAEIRQAGIEAVGHRLAEIATRLGRTHQWMVGVHKEPLREQDLAAVAEAARHFKWLAEVFNRRNSRVTR